MLSTVKAGGVAVKRVTAARLPLLRM